MNLKEKLKALLAEAAELQKKGAELTEEDVARVPVLTAEIADTKAKIDAQDAAAEALKSAVAADDTEHQEQQVPAGRTKSRGDVPASSSIGQAFVESESLKAFRAAHPNGVAKGNPISIEARGIASKKTSARAVKAPLNTVDNGDTSPLRLPGIEDVTYRKPNTLLDLITVGTTAAPWLEYRQLVSITNNAAIVPEARTVNAPENLKPISDLRTRKADAKAHTYADGIEATTQELNDDGAMTSLIDGILTQNLRDEIERIVLVGDEAADEPNGIMNTTGVLQQAFVTDAVTSVRKAKTLLWETSSTAPQAILLNPEDDEEFDLLKDANERFYGNGPFGTGPQSIWAVPRVVSSAMPKGQALMGQFSAFQLLIFEALAILAFNQHKDYAQRNLVYVRAELRALQMFRQPAKLAVVDLETGA